MAKEKNDESPPSIEQALGENRMEQLNPPQGEAEINNQEMIPEEAPDELVTRALAEARAEEQILPPSIKVAPDPPPKAEKIIPASSTDLPSAIEHSSRESQESIQKPKIESEYQSLRDFLHGDGFNKTSVQYIVAEICSIQGSLPYPNTWLIPKQVDMIQLVYDIIIGTGYLSEIWPTLKIIMGTSIGNLKWAANIVTFLALHDALRLLPIISTAHRQNNVN